MAISTLGRRMTAVGPRLLTRTTGPAALSTTPAVPCAALDLLHERMRALSRATPGMHTGRWRRRTARWRPHLAVHPPTPITPALSSASTNPEYAHLEQHDGAPAYDSLVPGYGQVASSPVAGSRPGSTDPECDHLEQHDGAYASLVPVYGQVAPHASGATDYSHIRPGDGDAVAWQQ